MMSFCITIAIAITGSVISAIISMLSRTGRATAEFVVPFVIRSLGGDLLILLTFLLLIFAMRPHVLPRWTDENDLYDRIWE